MPFSTHSIRLVLTLALAFGMAACGDDSDYTGNVAAEPDAMPDSSPEATPDSEPEASPDAAPDSEPEMEPDPNPDPEPTSVIGTPCESNAECGFGGFCITDFPDGYCITGCDPADPEACDGGNPCLRLGENDLCVDACESARAP